MIYKFQYKTFLKVLTKRGIHGMLKLWQGLAIRLSVLRKSSRSQTFPAGEELLRILRNERSTRRKPHLIVQAGRLLGRSTGCWR